MTANNRLSVFGYYVNFDRPEEFFADVRNTVGETIFELRDMSIIELGAMQHKRDVNGLRRYLVREGVMAPDQILLLMAA